MNIATELGLVIPAPYLSKKTLILPEIGADKGLMFGVELEIENINMDIGPNGSVVPGMSATEDGSLRNNGYEFITKPMFLRELVYTLNQFFLKNKYTNKNYSDRTSVHVHANVGDMTWEQVHILLLVYIAFEHVLFKFIGNDRDKNIYCVPMYDTILSADLIKGKGAESTGKWRRWEKYTALNLLPIFNQTTVEFRHMEGTPDVNRIITWCMLISQMFHYAKNSTLEETKAFFLELNTTSAYREAVFRVFGEHANVLINIGGIEQALEEGVLFTKYSLGIAGESLLKLRSRDAGLRIAPNPQEFLPGVDHIAFNVMVRNLTPREVANFDVPGRGRRPTLPLPQGFNIHIGRDFNIPDDHEELRMYNISVTSYNQAFAEMIATNDVLTRNILDGEVAGTANLYDRILMLADRVTTYRRRVEVKLDVLNNLNIRRN